MKRFLIVIFSLSAASLLGQSNKIDLLGTYSNQNIFSGMDFSEQAHESRPYIMKIFNDGIFIADTDRNRVIRLNSTFKVDSEIEIKDTPTTGDAFENYYYSGLYFVSDSSNTILYQNPSFIWDYKGNLLAKIISFQSQSSVDSISSIYRVSNRVFYLLKNGEWRSYSLYDVKNGGIITTLNDIETRALFAAGSLWPHPGLELDQKNRLILNDEILTKDWKVFISWMLEKYGTIKRGPRMSEIGYAQGVYKKGVPFNPEDLRDRLGSVSFKGRDAAGNWYWDYIVISKDGTLLDVVPPSEYGTINYSVAPNGDYYYLIQKENFIQLSRLENTWSPEAKIAYQEGLKKGLYKMPEPPATAYRAPNGTVLEDGVRVRWNPNTQEGTGINTNLKKGTVVQILARTQAKETIGGHEAYWYAVKTPEGVYGWSFGAFIQVPDPDKVMVGNGYFGPYQPPVER